MSVTCYIIHIIIGYGGNYPGEDKVPMIVKTNYMYSLKGQLSARDSGYYGVWVELDVRDLIPGRVCFENMIFRLSWRSPIIALRLILDLNVGFF